MNWKSVVLVILSTFLIGGLKAQTCGLMISNKDSLSFSLFVGGKLAKDDVVADIQLDSLECTTVLLDLIVKDSSNTHLRTDLQLDTAWIPMLELSSEFTGVQLRLLNPREPVVEDLTAFPTSTKETLEVAVMQVENSTCFPPSTPTEVMELTAVLEGKDFEKQRIALLEKRLPNLCLTTSQIEMLINTIEDEEKRLSILQFAYDFCYDKSNYSSLTKLLYLERNIASFEEWIP